VPSARADTKRRERPEPRPAPPPPVPAFRTERYRDEPLDRPPRRPAQHRPVQKKPVLFLTAGAVLVLGLLVGGFFLLRSGRSSSNEEASGTPTEARPSDLDFLDPTAQGFVTLQVAAVWKLDVTQKFYDQIRDKNPMLEGGLQAMEMMTGLGLGDIERVSAVVADADKQLGWGVAATRKPYDRDKILAQLKGARRRRHEDKTYYVVADRGDRPGEEFTIYFVNDRIAVAGPQDGVKRCLGFLAEKKSAGPLSDAIKLAGEGKHHLVAAVHPPADRLKQFQGEFKGMAKAFVWVTDIRAATLTVDLGKTSRLDATLTFAEEARARQAGKTLDTFRGSFELFVLPDLEERWKLLLPPAEVKKHTEQVKNLLGGVSVARKGKSVHVRFKGDIKDLGSLLLVPTRKAAPFRPRRPEPMK
jgi:hypothetical protein